ncbi:MAG: AAA family ATPase [Coriobacteriia bacterium]|nr:AAA family ATPase [Coriobacteriia bacterium]
MVDILLIVSSAIERCCAQPLVHGCEGARATYCFHNGQDCISYVRSLPEATTIIALVDSQVSDISSLNLVNTLRSLHAGLQAIVVLPSNNETLTQRAMFAGACSAVYESCSQKDLETLITKVVKSSLFRQVSTTGSATDEFEQGAAIAVVSARGGSGKSYLSTLLAATLARSHKDTLLFDADIQFSDLGLLFHKSAPVDVETIKELPTLDKPSLHALSYFIARRLDLLRFTATPLHAERLALSVTASVRACRKRYEATVINTGGFWTLFQTNLLESCNCIVITCDHSLAGVKATQKLLAHFEQLRIPLAQVIVVVNQYHKRGVALHDIETTLGSTQVVALASFPQDACASLDAGQPMRVLEEFDSIAETLMILAERVSVMTGIPLHGTREFDAQISRKSWLQKVLGR